MPGQRIVDVDGSRGRCWPGSSRRFPELPGRCPAGPNRWRRLRTTWPSAGSRNAPSLPPGTSSPRCPTVTCTYSARCCTTGMTRTSAGSPGTAPGRAPGRFAGGHRIRASVGAGACCDESVSAEHERLCTPVHKRVLRQRPHIACAVNSQRVGGSRERAPGQRRAAGNPVRMARTGVASERGRA